jgi:hypothetical protein
MAPKRSSATTIPITPLQSVYAMAWPVYFVQQTSPCDLCCNGPDPDPTVCDNTNALYKCSPNSPVFPLFFFFPHPRILVY